MTDINDWLKSGAHLPVFMRDFHAQKNLFKRIDVFLSGARQDRPEDYLTKTLPNWMMGQVYVIDFFLRYMAQCGYTLQKSRRRFDFTDVQEDVDNFLQAEFKGFAEAMKKD